jgi:hypothetical protein
LAGPAALCRPRRERSPETRVIRRPDRGIRFAHDSPLEGRVSCELVSEMPNSLLAGKIQGISPIPGLRAPRRQRKSARNQFLTGQFPTHPNREFFAALQGIKSGDQGSFRRDQGIPLSSAIWHSLLVTNPIVPTDFQRCREGEKGAADIRSRGSRSRGSTPAFVHVKGAPGIRKSLAELRRRERSAFRGGIGRVARRQLNRAPP